MVEAPHQPIAQPPLRRARAPLRRIGVALLGWTVALGACGGPQLTVRQRQAIELEPIEIASDRAADGKAQSYVKDHDTLYHEALKAFRGGQWAEALTQFERLLRDFPQQPSRYAVMFNAGLCLAKLGRHDEAAQRFGESRVLSRGTRHARDAIFLQAEALEAQQRWQDAAQVYRSTLEDAQTQEEIGGALGLLDELEAWARLGICLRKAGDPTRADKAFKRVERLYEDHRDMMLVQESEWVARAMFERAEIFSELFASIRFRLPVERMKKELEDKANLFLKSENVYYRCVRLRNKPWSLMCGLRVADLFAQLIADVEAAEVPPGLDAFTMEVYRDELWNYTEKPAKRAVVLFRNNMDLAERMGEKNGEWYEKSWQGLKRMEQLIEVNTLRRAKLLKPETPSAGAVPSAPANLPMAATPSSADPK